MKLKIIYFMPLFVQPIVLSLGFFCIFEKGGIIPLTFRSFAKYVDGLGVLGFNLISIIGRGLS